MIRDILSPMNTLDIRLSISLIEAISELRQYLLLKLLSRMSRPPRIPSRVPSPSRSVISGISGYSVTSDESGRHTPNGFSEEINSILGSFSSAPRFSQLDQSTGRGNAVLAQTIGYLGKPGHRQHGNVFRQARRKN